jgi:hypothetical protein
VKCWPDGLTLEALRSLAQGVRPHLNFLLVRYCSGYALRYDLNRSYGIPAAGFLLAERSKKIRIFKTSDTALKLVSDLAIEKITIQLTPFSYSSVRDRHPLDTNSQNSDNIDTVKALNGVST